MNPQTPYRHLLPGMYPPPSPAIQLRPTVAVAAPSEVPNTIVQVWCLFACLIKNVWGFWVFLGGFFLCFSKLGTGVFFKFFFEGVRGGWVFWLLSCFLSFGEWCNFWWRWRWKLEFEVMLMLCCFCRWGWVGAFFVGWFNLKMFVSGIQEHPTWMKTCTVLWKQLNSEEFQCIPASSFCV